MENNLENLVEELELDKEKIKPVEKKEGLIAYRKYLWALKFINEKIDRLKVYREQIVKDVDYEIAKQIESVSRIKGAIEFSILEDPIATKTKTGGRTLSLPDIATVSLSKEQEKVQIDDPEAILEALGEEFKKVKVSLDTTKAKKHLLNEESLPEGANKTQSRTLSIRFKR